MNRNENKSFVYNLIIKTLNEIFNHDAYINNIISGVIKEFNLSGNDKSIYTKIVYGTVENKLLIDYKLKPYLEGKTLKPYIKNALRCAIYVIDEMSLANHFICDVIVDCVKNIDFQASKLVNGVLRSYLRNEKPVSIDKLPFVEKLSIKYSLPLDIVNLIMDDYGDDLSVKEFEELIKNLTKSDELNTYVVNRLKLDELSINELINNLKSNYDLEVYDDFIVSKDALINTKEFKTGLLIPMNYSSTLPGKVLNPIKGSSVLDCCAAPGSKSLYMSMLMDNSGSITSLDIYEHKMELIDYNAKKYGSKIVKSLLADAKEVKFNNLFDYILVDGPCSGLGVMSHKPDLKYRVNLKSIDELAETNYLILSNVSKYLKVGGTLVFSTCTITHKENDGMIKNFLNKYKNFDLIEEEQILPNSDDNLGKDGFYICKMIKKG